MRQRMLQRIGLAFALAVLAAPAMAQKISGEMFGTVTDPAGAVLPGATVNAECTATKQMRTTTTDATGGFRLTDLPVCTYHVTATLEGFKVTGREVQVVVSTVTKADFQMQIG